MTPDVAQDAAQASNGLLKRRYITVMRVAIIVVLAATLTLAAIAGELSKLWEPASIWMFIVGFLLGVLTVRRLW